MSIPIPSPWGDRLPNATISAVVEWRPGIAHVAGDYHEINTIEACPVCAGPIVWVSDPRHPNSTQAIGRCRAWYPLMSWDEPQLSAVNATLHAGDREYGKFSIYPAGICCRVPLRLLLESLAYDGVARAAVAIDRLVETGCADIRLPVSKLPARVPVELIAPAPNPDTSTT